ncbi:MAG: SMC-Scp complex subunit ScpB [Planctomycetaceae bacterium]|nr:SMC-Scp complex subunit ScpB [Planctomycetaceae bacterium]
MARDSSPDDDGLSESENMDDLIFGFSGLDDTNSLEELSQAYAQLLAEQDLLNVDIASELRARPDNPQVSSTASGNRIDVQSPTLKITTGNELAHGMEQISGKGSGATPNVETYVDLRRMVEAARLGEPEDRVAVTPQRILEAILFVGTEDNSPLAGRLLASLMRGISADEVDSMVDELNRAYESEGTAYRIVREALGYRMELAADHATMRQPFYGQVREAKLPQAVIDVLALVAYHQPVGRKQVEKLIGNSCGAHLNQLLRRNLIQLSKDPELGAMYRTTARFLELFGLDSLEDLPHSESLDSDA